MAEDGDTPLQTASEPLPRVPITLLTGFLGAGKTARLNITLENTRETRIAVIENELGVIGVDGALVANRHDDGVIELANGCLCCSAEVDLIAALEALARRRPTRPFHRVIIETTGLADVAPVISLLRDEDDPLAKDFTFDGVLTIADAVSFNRWATASSVTGTDGKPIDSTEPLVARSTGFGAIASAGTSAPFVDAGPGRKAALTAFWRQITLADRIVVSKADLVGPEDVANMCSALSSMNPLADVVVDETVQVEGGLPLGPLPLVGGPISVVGNTSVSRGDGPGLAGVGGRHSGWLRLSSAHSRGSRGRGAAHLEGVQALAFHLSANHPLNPEEVCNLVRSLLQENNNSGQEALDGEAWRVKGIINIHGIGLRLLQGVGDQVELSPWAHGVEGSPFVVVIGEGLNREQIEAALVGCREDVERPAKALR
eukprot:TRINITY_DN76127_c0_g1_i1.p1 TRINITY_DN76127_c0_g1~~TRINITY_DN76127_c0_g1_i1.p1  ORF type:complete len:429 (-),score=66.05 TRINITY_DN76127_c0_g1_i1:53-1339(-)